MLTPGYGLQQVHQTKQHEIWQQTHTVLSGPSNTVTTDQL